MARRKGRRGRKGGKGRGKAHIMTPMMNAFGRGKKGRGGKSRY